MKVTYPEQEQVENVAVSALAQLLAVHEIELVAEDLGFVTLGIPITTLRHGLQRDRQEKGIPEG